MAVDKEVMNAYKSYANKEKGVGKEAFWAAIGDTDYNPDKISIKTYCKMLEDAQVYAAFRIISLAALSKGIDLRYDGKDKTKGEEMKNFLKTVFKTINTDLNKPGGMWYVLHQLSHNGRGFGYAVAETVFGKYDQMGDGYIYPTKLKVLPPKTLVDCFKISDYGDLEAIIQNRQYTNEVTWQTKKELFRMLVFTHKREFSDWYGQSDLKVNYKNWFIKDYLIKFWNIAVERYGAPFLLGKVSNPSHISAMDRALDSARTKTNFSIWKNDDVEILESTKAGQKDVFLNAIQYHDSQIMIGQVVPLLLMGVEATGARALGDVHFRVFLWNVRNHQQELADTIQHWINKLIDMNFADVDEYPQVVFPVIANEDLTAMADAFFKLVNVGIVDAEEDWIRKMMSIPDRTTLERTGGMLSEEEEKPVEAQPPTQEQEEEMEGEETEAGRQLRQRKYNPRIVLLDKMLTRQEKKVYNILKRYLNTQQQAVIDRPNSFKRESKTETTRALRLELNNISEDAIDFENTNFENIGITMDTQFTRAALTSHIKDLMNQTFKGSVDDIAFQAKAVVLQGLEEGLNRKEISRLVSEVYGAYTSNQLKTVARTITNDVHNSARLELYKRNSDFVTHVRYDAVLDDRTTLFCEFHDGMVLELGNPDVEAMRPPNHFQCRSIYTPVTVLEAGVKEDYEIGNIYPQERFGQSYFINKYGQPEVTE